MPFPRLGREELTARIEHTVLSPSTTWRDVERVLEETERYGFRCSVVPPYVVAEASASSRRPVCTVAGFPLGYQPIEVKVRELEVAAGDGATEIDVVMNVSAFLDGKLDFVKREVGELSRRAHELGVEAKIIIETGLLNDRVGEAAALVVEGGAHYIKTCTGFGPRGVTVEDILEIRRAVSDKARIKAAGGVREAAFALLLLTMGADTIGTSSGPRIVEGLASLREDG